jgi:hypothetical protein
LWKCGNKLEPGLDKMIRAGSSTPTAMIWLPFVLLLGTSGCERVKERLKIRPKQEQAAERVAEISDLDIQREGRLTIEAIPIDGLATAGTSTRVRYSLSYPAAAVEDTDIRGYLDGTTKHPFNQGTAYHMRVGRRFGGPRDGRYELKRSLVRWRLPELPANARLISAEVTFWVEAFLSDSPLADEQLFRPLHLYLYPVSENWEAGLGGRRQNDFSPAAPGEAWWNEARLGELAWPAPGALEPAAGQQRRGYRDLPVGVGAIVSSDTTLTIGGDRLLDYLRDSNERHGALSLLLKLEDEEEDRIGTELAFLASNFGDVNDALSKRPRLDFEIEIPYAAETVSDDFVVEAGTEYLTKVLTHRGRTVLLSATVSQSKAIAQGLFVRGGSIGDSIAETEWEVFTNPILRRWDWSQFRIASPLRWLSWGDSIKLDLHETWVWPGPREKQLPELLLIAPSGRTHRVQARATPDLHYVMEFEPDEFGLWKYGWSYRPTPTRLLGGHQGDGVFFVGNAEGDGESAKLEELSIYIIENVRRLGYRDAVLQSKVNVFVRWAVRYGRKGPEEKETSERLLAAVREALEAAAH